MLLNDFKILDHLRICEEYAKPQVEILLHDPEMNKDIYKTYLESTIDELWPYAPWRRDWI